MDLAHIGFKATTTDLDKADKKLDKLGKTASSTEKEVTKSNKGVSKSFSITANAIKNSASAIIGSTAAALLASNQLSKSYRELQVMADMSGQSVAKIEALSFAYRQFGLDIEQVNDIYKDSTERIGEWINEQSGELDVFGAAMGMTKQQITAFAKEVESLNGQQLLQRMVDDMEEAGIQGSRMSNVLESMASEATKMIPALKNSGSALSGFQSRFDEATKGMELSGDEAKSLTGLAASFDLAVDTVSAAMTKLVAGNTASLLDTLVNDFTDGVTEISKRLRVLGVSVATFDFTTSIRAEHAELTSELISIRDDLQQYAGEDIATLPTINPFGKSKNEWFNLQNAQATVKERLKSLSDLITKEQKAAIGDWDFMDQLNQDSTTNTGSGGTGITSTAYKEQVAALAILESQVGKTASELFVMNEVQKSIARNDAPELTEAIRKQSEMIALARVENEKLNESKTANEAWLQNIKDQTGEIQKLEEEILKVQQAMIGGLDSTMGTEYIAQLRQQIEDLKVETPMSGWNEDLKNFSSGVGDAFKSIQGLSKNGSKEYKKLGVAVSALNALQAVSAVLNQGKGDPYTALGRMAAMAAAVASLGVSIGGLSGSLGDESAENQVSQGLNVWGEKSESISNSIDMTANATEKLVGINTSMLQALRSVQTGISNASALIARNNVAAKVDIGSLGISDNVFSPIFDNIIGDFLSFTTGGLFTKTIGKFLGGKSKITDEGIRIIGGSLGNLIDDVTVQAFQSVKYKKWRFGSTKRKTQYEDISDEVGNQVSLVFGSIADSVYLGATALGMSGEEVTKAINDFRVSTIKISLKGLSAEKQQKEINAVFSRLFDNLASDVIDFLPDFQQVGEGLGETLSRLAAEVQIADLITSRFGTNFGDKMADTEAYATAADNLAELVGGVDKLAEATANFTESFATDAQKLEIQQRELSEAFNEAGLTLPTTTQGMWDLMQSLDGTTEQGREQIALLLELTGVSSSYLNLLEKVSSRYTNAIDAMYKSSAAVKQIGLDAALAAARLGDMSLAEALDLGALNPNQSDFGSFADFAFEQAVTANKIQELADLSKVGVSDAQKQIDLLDQIADNTSKESSDSQTVKVDTAALNNEMKMMRAENKTATTNQAKTNAELTLKISRLVSIEETRLLEGV